MPYIKHGNFDQFADPGDTLLWRYMNIYKLIRLLETEHLYFCKISEFDDLNEGFVEPWDSSSLAKALDSNGCMDKITKGINRLRSRAKDFIFANCWNYEDQETSVMWDSYGKSDKDNVGLCIKTNAQKLYDSIIDERNIYSGIVNYVSKFSPTLTNIYLDAFIKHETFKGEKELRLINVSPCLQDESIMSLPEKGITVKVNVRNLIDKIILHPSSNAEDFAFVTNKIRELGKGYDFNIIKSSILYRERKSVYEN
jgi:hypothetical protein